MPPIRQDQPLVPSVLDRLLDDDPQTTREPPRNRAQLLRELKASVRRDLNDLLNTRRPNLVLPAGFAELKRSLLAYGLPDFSGGAPTGGKAKTAFAEQLAAVVRANEPRLLRVTVDVVSGNEPLDRTLRFKIDALLRADPAPEPVTFDSVLEPVTGTFEVSGGDR